MQTCSDKDRWRHNVLKSFIPNRRMPQDVIFLQYLWGCFIDITIFSLQQIKLFGCVTQLLPRILNMRLKGALEVRVINSERKQKLVISERSYGLGRSSADCLLSCLLF